MTSLLNPIDPTAGPWRVFAYIFDPTPSFGQCGSLLCLFYGLFFDDFDGGLYDLLFLFFIAHEHLVHDPRVVGQLLHADSGFWVDIEAPVNDIEAGVAQILFDFAFQLVLALLDKLDGLVIVGTLKRQVPMQHSVQNDSARPYVDPTVYFVVF